MRFAWMFLAAVACDEPARGGDPSPAVGEGEGQGAGGSECRDAADCPDPDPAPAPIIVADAIDFLEKLHAQRCAWAIHCEIQANATLSEVQRVSCGEAVRADFDLDELTDGGIAGGRLIYSQAAAQDCIRDLATVTGCAELWRRHTALDVCPGALVGQQDHGEPCTLQGECGAEGFCFFEGTCPGVCIKGDGGLSLNEECAVTGQCVAGLRCLEAVCRLARLEGEACAHSLECGPALHCAQRGDPAGTCTPVGKLDEVCWADLANGTASSCVDDLVCSGARRDNAGHCGPGLDLGDTCSDESPCRVGARCVDDRCQSTVGPLELCRGHGQCPAAQGCFAFECRAAGLEDERCDRDRPCDQGICVNERCAFLPVGAGCEARSQQGTLKVCPDGFHCGIARPSGEGEGEGADPEDPVTQTCVEGPGFGEACIQGPVGDLCKEVMRCHGGFCGRPCVP